MIEFDDKRWWHGVTRWISSTTLGAKALSSILHRLDKFTIQRSNGRYSLSNLLGGTPIVTLTTIGAKSGRPRTMPLIGIPDGDNVILIASNWGGEKNPAWYYNLRANPEVTLMYKGKSATYLAGEVRDEERDRCWAKAVDLYPGYAGYTARAGDRQIPVIVLKPQTET